MTDTKHKRTIVYIDGLNLYYRRLKRTPYKWLDLVQLAREVLEPENDIISVNFYYAPVSGKTGDGAHDRQQVYIRALKTVAGISFHTGRFMESPHYLPLAETPEGTSLLIGQKVRVLKFEEKGSDVTLGAHLVRDAFTDAFDVAAVVTNDTDLVEPIRIVTQEKGLPVVLITPIVANGKNRVARDLAKVATTVKPISDAMLARAQLPDPVTSTKGQPIRKPSSW